MNCRIASSVAGEVGFAAMDVEDEDTRDERDDVEGLRAEEAPEAEGGGVGRCRRRNLMLPPVRKQEMWEDWKRSIILRYLPPFKRYRQ